MNIKVIEPIKKDSKSSKLRVCAYARVSTKNLGQKNSLENQKEAYKNMIMDNPKYEYAGVFADRGITGRSENRPGFKEMLDKARGGEIDLIITKSISRFARKTTTVIRIARELKELNVGIYFEEEKINTLSGEGEMMISVIASFAEEESRSISENVKWMVKKKFENGEIIINTERFMGYTKNKNGDLVVESKQAEIVKRIFNMYLNEMGSFKIAAELNNDKVKTISGAQWRENTIIGMLKNEKYKGDYILQKYYVPQNSRGSSIKNKGEKKSYYIKNNHPGIISEEDWDKVQTIMEDRKKKRKIGIGDTSKYKNRYPLSGMLICPYCLKSLRRKQVHNKKIEWWCSTYIKKGKSTCKGVKVSNEEAIKKNIQKPTVIEEVIVNGKKYYSYTGKKEYESGIRNSKRIQVAEDGSVLQGFNSSRRTVIKL